MLPAVLQSPLPMFGPQLQRDPEEHLVPETQAAGCNVYDGGPAGHCPGALRPATSPRDVAASTATVVDGVDGTTDFVVTPVDVSVGGNVSLQAGGGNLLPAPLPM